MSSDDYEAKRQRAVAEEMVRKHVLDTYPSLGCPDDPPEERYRVRRYRDCCAIPFAERIATLEQEKRIQGSMIEMQTKRADMAETQALAEANRADAAEAQRDRLAALLRDALESVSSWPDDLGQYHIPFYSEDLEALRGALADIEKEEA